jgi:hypothetical protein
MKTFPEKDLGYIFKGNLNIRTLPNNVTNPQLIGWKTVIWQEERNGIKLSETHL